MARKIGLIPSFTFSVTSLRVLVFQTSAYTIEEDDLYLPLPWLTIKRMRKDVSKQIERLWWWNKISQILPSLPELGKVR